MIRLHETGQTLKFNDVVIAVVKSKDCTFDPTKVKLNTLNARAHKESKENAKYITC
jgi:hypothetical protein